MGNIAAPALYMGRPITTENAEKVFLYIYQKYVHREGADKFINWLCNETDFLTAPASTRFHLSVPHGLVLHSVHVYLRLRELYMTERAQQIVRERYTSDPSQMQERLLEADVPLSAEEEETLAIIGLLHDICKANCYVVEQKNFKNYDEKAVENMRKTAPREVKSDSKGAFFWDTRQQYSFEDHRPMGHGCKSTSLCFRHGLTLTETEEYAILWHMGAWGLSDVRELSNAFTLQPLCVLTHTADMFATYLDEYEDDVADYRNDILSMFPQTTNDAASSDV